MKTVNEVLKNLGLNDTEIKTYLTILELGTNSASVIGNRANINRSTTQYTCQKLVKIGLLTMSQKNNIFLFTPEPPEKLLFLLEKEKQVIENKEAEVKKVLGDLKGIMNPNIVLPKVRFYEGVDGIKRLYEGILEQNSKIYSIEDNGEMHKFIPDYTNSFIKKRISLNIENKVICPDQNTINKNEQTELRETRTIPYKDFPFSGDIKICNDKVYIFSFENNGPVGISIQHKEISNNFKKIFDYIWNKTKSN